MKETFAANTYDAASFAALALAGTPVSSGADGLRYRIDEEDLEPMKQIGAPAGARVAAAAGLAGPGAGRLRVCGEEDFGDPPGGYVQFQAPGSATFGQPVPVPASGEYLAEDGEDTDRWLRVIVYRDYVQNVGEVRLELADRYANGVGGADVDAGDAAAGQEVEYTIELKNIGMTDLLDLRAWLGADVTHLEIGTDGVDYYSPDAEDHGDVLVWDRLEPLARETLYLKRTLPADSEADPAVLTLLHFGWDGE